MRSIAKKLALLLPITALIFVFLAVATPQARAEEMNKCAGTVTETGSNLIMNKGLTFYPQLGNNGETPEGNFGLTWPLGPVDLKITATDGIKKGDYVTITNKENSYFRDVATGYVTDASGGKVAYVSNDNGVIKVTWTAYAASRRDVSANLQVIIGHGMKSEELLKVPGRTITLNHQLTSCSGPLPPHKTTYSYRGFSGVVRNMVAMEDGDALRGYVTLHGDNSAAGATKTVGVANTLYRTRYQIGNGLKADCDLAITEDQNPANNFGFARFNRWNNADIRATQDNLRRTTVIKGGTNPKAGTFGLVCSADGKTVDIYYRSQGAADAQYAYFPLVSDGKKLDQLPRNNTGNVTVPFTVTVWNNGGLYSKARTLTAIAPKVVNAGGSSTAQPGKLTVVKKGNNLEPGSTFNTGTNVDFTYEVANIGGQEVSDITVTDSKGVKVTCPKYNLKPKESMTCTGRGKVVGSPGIIAPPNPGSGDVKDPSGLNED